MFEKPPPGMVRALAEAKAAAERGEVPVGAVIVAADGNIVAAAGNRTRELFDASAHAEILAIRSAGTVLANERLNGCTLYVTLEPCPMCAAAISLARIGRVVFGAEDPKMGGVVHGPRIFDQPNCNHRPEVVGGIGERASAQLLQDFFRSRRL